MKTEEYAGILQKGFPPFGKKIINDITPKGEEFCEIIYKNPHSDAHPLTVTVYEDGAYISFGNMQKVTGEGRLDVEQMCCAIEDIISDKVMFVFCYADEEKKDDKRLSDSYVFALTGDDDMSSEYDEFIRKIKTPLNKFSRMFSPIKGIFNVRNFSGSIDFEVKR